MDSKRTGGFFLLGQPTARGGRTSVFEPGLLRDGGDAVALFEGDSADFAFGALLTTNGLLDAVVYGTADQTNPFLIDSLTPGQPQMDEWMLGIDNGGALAWARLPDGGASLWLRPDGPSAADPRLHERARLRRRPHHGAGQPRTARPQVCVDLAGGFLPFFESSNALDSQYGLVVTNLDGEVIDVVPDGEGNLGYDFSGSPSGPCLVWGMSYDGDLDPTSIAAGAPYDSISATGCVAFSALPVEVNRIYCLPPSCDGGAVSPPPARTKQSGASASPTRSSTSVTRRRARMPTTSS